MTAWAYIPEKERAPRMAAVYQAGRGWCRGCNGIIVVPDGPGFLVSAALRQHHRIDPDNIPTGWRLYRRAGWHPWCLSYRSKLESPTALDLDTSVCAACGTDFGKFVGKSRYVALPWCCSPVIPPRSSFGWRRRHMEVLLTFIGFDIDKSLLEVDHIVPLWAGGIHQISNLQALCQPCHKVKTKIEARLRAAAKKEAL